MNIPKCLITLFIIIFTQSCNSQYYMSVSAISTPRAKEKNKYLLIPSNEDTSDTDLQFQEYAAYTHNALSKQGFEKAENINEAEVAILLAYGIGEPQASSYTYSTPTYGQTGVSSSRTYGNAYVSGNSINYSGNTTYTPSYGVTGYTSNVGTYVYYRRHLTMTAIDLEEYRKTKKQVELWKVMVVSSGENGDLRTVFPIMVAGARGYIGETSKKAIKISLDKHDKEVKEIKSI